MRIISPQMFTFLISFCSSAKISWHSPVKRDVKPYNLEDHISDTTFTESFNPTYSSLGQQCAVDKIIFTQNKRIEYLEYSTQISEMKEFTLCFWSMFKNHTKDHPIFSYATESQPKAIYSWISNTEKSSYLSLAVGGHTFFRLNYPFRKNNWYHICESWNGRSGEWQIWVNAERIGRGFNNRLIGYQIPEGGVAISGQEYLNILWHTKAIKESEGMIGEITMLQLYKVALSAGKAHRNHKHHHAHKFDHNGNQITTTHSSVSSRKTMSPTQLILKGRNNIDEKATTTTQFYFKNGILIDGYHQYRSTFGDKIRHNLQNSRKKRELLVAGGTIVEDNIFNYNNLQKSIDYGLTTTDNDKTFMQTQQEREEWEAAGAEVKAVMNICSQCHEEPFTKALVIGWKTVPKKIYTTTYPTPSVCPSFSI